MDVPLVEGGIAMRDWQHVSPHTPCPICWKSDWCCVSMDGAWAICRRVNTGIGRHKQDKGGTEYWLYRLDGSSLQPRPTVEVPPPSNPMCADTGTLDRVYRALLDVLPLVPFHHQALRQRGLVDAEILRRRYRTFPRQGRAVLAKRLVECVGADVCAHVPGFYLAEQDGRRWWSLSSWIPNAALAASELAPQIAERLTHYEVKAALLIPASRLCHQTLGIVAREIERRGIPTMLISVDRSITDKVRPPRTAYYDGEIGATVGKPNWKEYQLRVLDESLRWIETFDQPGSRKLAVDLETETEQERGEK